MTTLIPEDEIVRTLASLDESHMLWRVFYSIAHYEKEQAVEDACVPGQRDEVRQFNAGRLAYARDFLIELEEKLVESKKAAEK